MRLTPPTIFIFVISVLLVGLGITELSMSAPSIPRAKQIVRGLAFDSARARAEHALTLSSPQAIRAHLQQSTE